MAGWGELAITIEGTENKIWPITSVLADGFEERLWSGTQMGRISSYLTPTMDKLSSVPAFHEAEVKQMLSNEAGVISLSATSIAYHSRGGVLQTKLSDVSSITNLQCMALTSRQTVFSLYAGGQQSSLIQVDMGRGKIVRDFNTVEAGCVVMKLGTRALCCAGTDGTVILRDPHSLKAEHVLSAHGSCISDMDVCGNFITTCGFSMRNGRLYNDPFIMVYDIRSVRSLAPMKPSFHGGPYLLKFLPKFSSQLVAVSQTGQLQIMDCQVPNALQHYPYQMDTGGAYITSLDVSSSSEILALGDSAGSIHVWADKEDPIVNQMSSPVVFPAPFVMPYASVDVDDYNQPLSTIGMPLYNEELLSDWTSVSKRRPKVSSFHRTPVPIDETILQTMKVIDFVGYAPNPRTHKRNETPPQRVHRGKKSLNKMWCDLDLNSYSDSDVGFDLKSSEVPRHYHRVQIEYSKLGMDDFDFGRYNKTQFGGLEPGIPNAYCNPLLQLLYFMSPFRILVENHLCTKDHCLACELGFLYHMLDNAHGRNCQASNFLRAFRANPQASALSLVLPDEQPSAQTDFSRLIQNCARFILQQTSHDLQSTSKDSSTDGVVTVEEGSLLPSKAIQQLFGFKMEFASLCLQCKRTANRQSDIFLLGLEYPPVSTIKQKKLTFSSVLAGSITKESRTKVWCEGCSGYQLTTQSRSLRVLPDVLTISCEVNKSSDRSFWESMNESILELIGRATLNSDPVSSSKYPISWIPFVIAMSIDDTGNVIVKEGSDAEEWYTSSPAHVSLFDLYGSICHVSNEADSFSGGHLVANVRVGSDYFERIGLSPPSSTDSWYAFNDFAITPISCYEAAHFNTRWKTPCILTFSRRDIKERLTCKLRYSRPFDERVLLMDPTPRRRCADTSMTFTMLTPEKIPKKGDYVAIDAEFVALAQAETEIRSDGKTSTVRPSQLTLARVTVVRACDEVPFIDDYIATTETVVDYLTKYSGIEEGDLNFNISTKHLVSLKSAYLKLRVLVDQGVIFVGHGLKKDFRMINLLVPKEQIIDTVELFRLTNQRRISLRFLAWVILGVDIQTGNHDSIEDSVTALRLYKKYKELTEKGTFTTTLNDIYSMGRQVGWRAPHWEQRE